MDPATIALAIQALDLAVKLAPEVLALAEEIKVAIGRRHAGTLAQIAAGTIQTDEQTRAILAPLLKGV